MTLRTRLAPSGRLALLVAAAAAAAAPAAVRAAEPLEATLRVRAGQLSATVDLGAAFPPALERQLGNGLTNVVAVLVSVVPEGSREPVAAGGRVLEILYDVWEETYLVTVKDRRTPAGRRAVLPDYGALRTFLSRQGEIDLGPVSALPPGRFRVEARVELNPISKELLERTRELIANPAASRGGPSRSVLGAMASFLLREPEAGSDVHVFRSRALSRGEVRPR